MSCLKVWTHLFAYREQLDSLMKLRWPLLAYGDIPWALHDPLCNLQNWSSSELIPDSSSFSAVVVGQVAHVIDLDLDQRSVTSWEVESAREDGELPTVLPAANLPDDSKVTMAKGSSEHVEHSRSLALITKSVTPSKKVKSRMLRKSEDDLEFMLDSDSDIVEQTCIDQEIENVRVVGKPWEDHAAKEFTLVLTRTYENERIAKLNAKVHSFLCPFFICSYMLDF